MIYYNSHDKFYKSPFGAARTDEKIKVRLRVDIGERPKSVSLRIWSGDQELRLMMTQEYDPELFCCEFRTPSEPDIIWYYFIIETRGGTLYYGNNKAQLGGEGRVYDYPPDSYQLTVYRKDFITPGWFKDCVMYQIFVDRFYNGNEDGSFNAKEGDHTLHKAWDEVPEYGKENYRANDFFGGNLRGIIKKLPYLKELGISVLYLNPIFEAYSNHKYDTGDYTKIDPMFGSLEDFRELCSRAEEYGIRVILDGVFNHTGSNSVYFNRDGKYDSIGAFQSRDSKYFSWYRFTDYPEEYECWWGFKTLPNVDELEGSFEDFIVFGEDSIVKRWIREGASGWRLDVADELPEKFIRDLRSEVKKLDRDAVIIGEVWEDASNKVSYGELRSYLLGEELDSVMNYPFRSILLSFLHGGIDGDRFRQEIYSLFENYPKETFYAAMNLVGSHDRARVRTVLGEAPVEYNLSQDEIAHYRLAEDKERTADRKVRLASAVQMTFPGVPCIYYGDEAGMQGYKDPFNRGTYPWGHEDAELIKWYRSLTKLRNETDCLRTGTFRLAYCANDIISYIRCIRDGKDVFGKEREDGFALTVINRSENSSHWVEVDVRDTEAELLFDALDPGFSIPVIENKARLHMHPLQCRILMDKKASGGK
jgi:4-alpha-glucanotransferase